MLTNLFKACFLLIFFACAYKASYAQSSHPVAITLLQMTVSPANNNRDALLSWTTENEINNDHYEIQSSTDGIQFNYCGTVPGNGTTLSTHNYRYTDHITNGAPVIYYRLKIVDLGGLFSTTKIVTLRLIGNSNNNFIVYPSPFTDKINVSLTVSHDVAAQFRIFSFSGKESLRGNIPLTKGDNVAIVKDLENIPQGSYLLEVTAGDKRFVQKIIKSK